MKLKNGIFGLFLLAAIFVTLGYLSGDVYAAPAIKATVVDAPDNPKKGDSITIDLGQYWRGNLVVENGILSGEKNSAAVHVPGLVEYAVDLKSGGNYELQAIYKNDVPTKAALTVDGEPLANLFEKAADTKGKWVRLTRLELRPGQRHFRLTSQYVETLIPEISGLRLVYRGGKSPKQPNAPQVVDYRSSLPADWYKTISRKIHGDFHTGGFVKGVGSKFDAEEYARTLYDNNINSICIFAKGHHGFAYYNTKVGTRHPGLDFDLMKAQIDACHKYGIAVWVYLSIAIDEMYGSTQEGQSQKASDHFIRVSAETNTSYVKDYTWPMIVECVRDYEIDGFFFDFPGNEAFVQETIKVIKDVKPGIAIAYNHQWDKSRDELGKIDILEIESWMHKQTLYHWQYVARYARGSVPLTAMTTRFWVGWGDFGGIADEAMMRYDVATGLANGCGITIGDQLHPHGRLDAEAYARIGRALEYAVKVEPYVFEAESVPYVALLKQSEQSCAALIDAGIHFDVIDESQDLTPYKALVVPDISKLDKDYADKIARYVEKGGSLLAGGDPTNSPLARVLGIVRDFHSDPEPAYLRINNDTLPTPPGTNLFSYHNVIPVKALDRRDVLAPLVWQMNHGTVHHVSHRQSPPMDRPSDSAAITEHRYGKGIAAYVAAPVFDIYATMGYTAMREIVSDLLERLIVPEDRVAEIETPASLEVSVNRQGERLIVHLVHCPQGRRGGSSFTEGEYVLREPIIDGMPSVSNAVLKMPAALLKGRTVTEIISGAELSNVTVSGDVASIRVPDFSIGTVLVIE